MIFALIYAAAPPPEPTFSLIGWKEILMALAIWLTTVIIALLYGIHWGNNQWIIRNHGYVEKKPKIPSTPRPFPPPRSSVPDQTTEYARMQQGGGKQK